MIVQAISLDLSGTGPIFTLPDASGLAPLALPAELRRGGGGIPCAQPAPDSVRRFEAAMAAPAADSPRQTQDAPAVDAGRALSDASHVSFLTPHAPAATPTATIAERIVPVSPEEADAMAPVHYFTASDGTVLPFREYVPEAAMSLGLGNSSGRARLPFVLYMHGAGARGSDGMALCENHGFKCLLSKVAASAPAIILAPQCPEDAKWVDTPWNEKVHVFHPTPSRHLAAALELFDRELESLPVDRSRILLCGGSMGGYAAWDILSRRPGLFAGALTLCGGGTPDKIAEAIRTTPVWTVHGAADDVVPVENPRAIVAAVQADSGHVAEFRYREMPGVRHDCWTATYSDPEVIAWLLARRREDVDPQDAPQAMPQVVQQGVLFAVPQVFSQDAPQDAPQAAQRPVPQAVPVDAPQVAPRGAGPAAPQVFTHDAPQAAQYVGGSGNPDAVLRSQVAIEPDARRVTPDVSRASRPAQENPLASAVAANAQPHAQALFAGAPIAEDPAVAPVRTVSIVETVNAVSEAVVAEIAATPAIVRGEGEVRIKLRPSVLGGSEILLSARDGALSVEITPATPEAARMAAAALPRLEEALAAHAHSFNRVAVSLASQKERNKR